MIKFLNIEQSIEAFAIKYPEQLNSFKILGVQSRERVYSSIISWFFKFDQLKEFKKKFFTNFLNLISKLVTDQALLDRIGKIDYFSLAQAEVLNEYFFTDILIHFEKEHFVIVIENKINARQGDQQLSTYREKITQHYKKKNQKYQFLYLFLTVDSSEPNDEAWYALGHSDIYQCVKNAYINSSPQNELVMDYLNIMEENILGISEKQRDARILYRKFRKEFDYIFENREDNVSFVTSLIVEKLQPYFNSNKIILLRESNTYVNFTTSNIQKMLGSHGSGEWFGDSIKDYFSFEFAARKDQNIVLRAVIGPTTQNQNLLLRDFLLKNSTHQGDEIFKKKGKLGNLYTTVLSRPVAKIDLNNGDLNELNLKVEQFVESFFKEEFVKIEEYFEKYRNQIENLIK
jgi:hypothetical protein